MRFGIVVALGILALEGCGKRAPTPQDELDRKFQEMMRGVTMVGRSTRLKDDTLGSESYAIDKVSKLAGKTWLFQARIIYKTHEVPVPIPVTIEWAGDTPVITLTDLSIPGVGTYTARVLLYRDQYAGTWSGKDHGGQLFGKIVHKGQ